MDILDHSEDEEERSYYGSGSRFGCRWQKPRSKSHHQLLLMDSVGNGNGNGGVEGDAASEEQEIVPLPEYERLSQSARLPQDPDPKNPLLPEYRVASPPPPPPPMPRPQKKPAAWRLIEYVRSRNKSGVPGGCGSSDGDSRSSDGEKEGEEGGGEEGKKEEKSKKRSSWLPDRERRWPVQGFY
jgi:hypothetical protein